MSEQQGTTAQDQHDEVPAADTDQQGLSRAEQAKAAFDEIPTRLKVRALVVVALMTVGAVTVTRKGGKLVAAGVRRVRR